MSYRSLKLELGTFVPELNAIHCGLRLNRSYQHLLDAHPWSFLNIEALVKMVGPYTTGTVAVTINLTTVTGTSTVWTSAMKDRFFRVSDNEPYYKITGLTLI